MGTKATKTESKQALLFISNEQRRRRSLYTWMARVTGVEGCWVEGTEEIPGKNEVTPVWGILKKVVNNVFAVVSGNARYALRSAMLFLPLLYIESHVVIAQTGANLSTVATTTINGQAGLSRIGRSVAIGDINADGLGDVLFVRGNYNPNTSTEPAQQGACVIFGTSAGFTVTPSAAINGTNGFCINREAADQFGRFSIGSSIASGDINGDNIADVIIGATRANPGSPARTDAGKTYVIFGKPSSQSFNSIFELSNLSAPAANGSTGFVINGDQTDDQSGTAVSSGDINGDNIADVIIGAPNANPSGLANAGKVYVVFGQSSFAGSPSIDVSGLNGTTGFTLNGEAAGFETGKALSSGDINGDGIGDVIIGVRDADILARTNTGIVHVVFGSSSGFSSSIDLSSLNGNNGFDIFGRDVYDLTGQSVASGDINGDNIADVIIGASNATSPQSATRAGMVYILFGKSTGFGSAVNLQSGLGFANDSDGIEINGELSNDRLGQAVSYGDINGDNIADVIIGTSMADPNGNSSGKTYVVFGKSSFAGSSSFNVSSLASSAGFVLNGDAAGDQSGTAVAGGDVNGDGLSDILVGANNGDYGSDSNVGKVYVFSNALRQTVTGNEGFRLISSPTSGTVLNELLAPLWTQGPVGSDSTNLAIDFNVWEWNTSIQGFIALGNQTTGFLSAGRGFLTYIFSDDNGPAPGNAGFPKNLSTTAFNGPGTLNSGTINPVSTLAANAFFMAGNPYAGPIDWDDTDITKTNLSNTIYIWSDAGNGGSGAYVSWNGTVGAITGGVIAPFQSFFIQATASGGGLSMTEGARTTANTSLLKQVGGGKALKIRAQAGDLEADAWLSLQDGGELSRDNFDGLFLQPFGAEYLSLGTISEGSELLQINALPVDQQETITLPLNLSGVTNAQTATLSFEGLGAFENWEITIHDNDTGQKYPVIEGASIELDITRVNTKVTPVLTTPTPTPMKAKVGSTRYSITLQPGGNEVTEDSGGTLPKEVQLEQNYPNPFNPTTNISFAIPQAGQVKLEVFDLLGQKIATLVNGQRTAGRYTVSLDASAFASGVYIYRLQVGNSVLTRSLTLIK